MGEISIRTAAATDISAITRIYRHAVEAGTASYELDPPDEKEMAARFANIVGAGYPWIVAEKNGVIAGYAYAGPFRARPAYRFIVEDSIYIDPAAAGRGIGAMLLTSLIEETERLGFRQLIAVIGDGTNHHASVRLHERLGFSHAGVIRGTGYKFGRWLDTVFMQRQLNEGSAAPPDPDSLPERNFRSLRKGGK